MKLMRNEISKSYGRNLALDRFTAEFESGVYALLGPNGSGKSTLMNIITDNLKADAGSILWSDDAGRTEDVLKMGARFREKIGFMPQYPGLYSNFTVERFMWYMAALKGIEKRAAGREIAEILLAVELDDVPKRKIGALSGGMRQRLTLAQAVLGSPELLILDEPTAGLDPKQRIAIRNYISKIAFNRIVVIATHVVPDIEFMARDVIMLKKGVITDDASPRELTEKLAGKVWSLPCGEDKVTRLQEKFKVTGISRDEESGGISLRILSDTAPSELSREAMPTLEDYYLYVFGDSASGNDS